jgi:hypothetical protein
MSPKWTLRALRYAYVAFIAAASAMALQAALAADAADPHSKHALVLAGPELLAALAFLFEPVERIACAVLLLVFLAATAVSLLTGDLLGPLRFIYFAATAIFIVLANRELHAHKLAT